MSWERWYSEGLRSIVCPEKRETSNAPDDDHLRIAFLGGRLDALAAHSAHRIRELEHQVDALVRQLEEMKGGS